MLSDIRSKTEQLWKRFGKSKANRHRWMASHISTNLAAQIYSLREARGWTQSDSAKEAGMLQPRIAVLEDPSYEKHSLSTLKRLAFVYDVALIVRFVRFSELLGWATDLTPDKLAPQPFIQDSFGFKSNELHRTPTAGTIIIHGADGRPRI